MHTERAHTQPDRLRPAVKLLKRRPSRSPAGSDYKSSDPRSEFSNEEWHDMVATAAYYRAEARGFESGSAEDDWYEAEAELREQLASAAEEAGRGDSAPPANQDVER